MKSTILLLGALALAYQDPPENLRFMAPEGAKPADVQAAAKVIQKRCEDYGYKGMTVKVIDQTQVDVACTTGITAVMRPKLTELATQPCSKLELMIEYVLNERENEQYEPGKTGPEGTQWIQLQDGWRLILTPFRMDLVGKIVWKRVTKKDRSRDDREPPDSYFDFQIETARALRKQYKGEEGRDLLLVIDGSSVNTNGFMRWPTNAKNELSGVMWCCKASKNELLGVSINNPLPIAFKPVKYFARRSIELHSHPLRHILRPSGPAADHRREASGR